MQLRRLERIPWTIPVVIAILAGLVYWATLAPTITWRNDGADSGDLVTAAFTLGIPHPPGYPLYTLITAAFAHLPFGEPARNVGLFSALAAALAVVFTCIAALELISIREGRTGWQWACAASVTLSLAFAPLFWSQATIAEVYALNALFVAALMAVLFSQTPYRLEMAALLFGLGLAHHYTFVLLGPTALLLLHDIQPNWARLGRAGLLVLLPLLFYFYLPLRAAAGPPVNWGDPQTPEGFGWTVSAVLYRPYLFNLTASDSVERAAATARFLLQQFNVWGVVIGFWGLGQLFTGEVARGRRKAFALLVGIGLTVTYAVLYGARDSYVYLLPAFVLYTLLIAYGLVNLARYLAHRVPRALLVLALVFLPMYNLLVNFQTMDLSRDRQAYDYAASIFSNVPGDAVVFADGDAHLFSLWYYRYVIARDSSQVVIVSPELLQFDWYYRQMRQEMPQLAPALETYDARVGEIAEQGLRSGSPVYTTTRDPVFQAYGIETVSSSPVNLYRIRGRGQ